ncbi:type 1 glutamine amidotransferase [Paenibacillus sp. LPE1-1-1.1]|uniref:type 1 glutamine amidotransferase n=1 Tax=Paenibacillus sp. LPE1-1-1.1 TaxID=3135230 RepID=UPI00341DA75F
MNIVAFKHFDFDDEYAFRSWAGLRGHRLELRDPSAGINEEWMHDLDLLIICGGPMSVYEEDRYPWLIREKQFVQQAMQLGKKVLGICFGAQMIAELLGSPVHRNEYKEIGWHVIHRTEERHSWLAGLPEEFTSFQWHGDTFALPEDARLLAYSEACKVQAFAYGEHVLGLQFHLETTPACMETMFEHWSSELIEAPYIQTAEQIRGRFELSGQSHKALHLILDQISLSR